MSGYLASCAGYYRGQWPKLLVPYSEVFLTSSHKSINGNVSALGTPSITCHPSSRLFCRAIPEPFYRLACERTQGASCLWFHHIVDVCLQTASRGQTFYTNHDACRKTWRKLGTILVCNCCCCCQCASLVFALLIICCWSPFQVMGIDDAYERKTLMLRLDELCGRRHTEVHKRAVVEPLLIICAYLVDRGFWEKKLGIKIRNPTVLQFVMST